MLVWPILKIAYGIARMHGEPVPELILTHQNFFTLAIPFVVLDNTHFTEFLK